MILEGRVVKVCELMRGWENKGNDDKEGKWVGYEVRP